MSPPDIVHGKCNECELELSVMWPPDNPDSVTVTCVRCGTENEVPHDA